MKNKYLIIFNGILLFGGVELPQGRGEGDG